MLQILKTLRELQSTFGVSLSSLLVIVKMLMDIGVPPSISDKAAFKEWVKKLTAALDVIAKKTSSQFDDQILVVLTAVLASDKVWDIFYTIIGKNMVDNVFRGAGEELADATELASAIAGDSPTMRAIDPLTIMAVIRAVVALIKMFR